MKWYLNISKTVKKGRKKRTLKRRKEAKKKRIEKRERLRH